MKKKMKSVAAFLLLAFLLSLLPAQAFAGESDYFAYGIEMPAMPELPSMDEQIQKAQQMMQEAQAEQAAQLQQAEQMMQAAQAMTFENALPPSEPQSEAPGQAGHLPADVPDRDVPTTASLSTDSGAQTMTLDLDAMTEQAAQELEGMKKQTLSLSGIANAFMQAAGSAVHWFVDAINGDDGNDGLTTDTALETVEEAYNRTSAGDVIELLSDIHMTQYVNIWHDLTIDGNGHTVYREDGFAMTSDAARSWYNPAMFEVHPDSGGTTVTFQNITLDDQFKHEGTSYTDQTIDGSGGNTNRVQDGIIAAYNDPANTYKSTVILEDGTTLQNYGGLNAVNLEGNSELVMKDGSTITNGGQNPNGLSYGHYGGAVYALAGGTLTMEKGSLIEGIAGANAIFTNNGTAVINGEITGNTGTSPIRSAGTSSITVGKDGDVHNNNGLGVGVLYTMGSPTIVIEGAFHDNLGMAVRGSGNGGSATIYIRDGADMYNNTYAVRSDSYNKIYLEGGNIHDNYYGILVRKDAVLTVTGGTVTGNTYGLDLSSDATTTAKILMEGGTVENNKHDYYIENTTLGYENGSYMYFSPEMLATNPSIDMQLNGKTVTIPTSNGYTYLGNASAASLGNTNYDSAATGTLRHEAKNLGFSQSNERASWWFRNDQGQASFDVSGLADNGEPLYALFVAVDESGNPLGNVYCTEVTLDSGIITAPMSTSDYADAAGYSVLILQKNVPVYDLEIQYKDQENNEIQDTYTAKIVKGSNYDVTAFVDPEIEDYYFVSSDLSIPKKGTADPATISSNISSISVYALVKEWTVKALSGIFTYDGQDHTVSGIENASFTLDGETYTIEGVTAEATGRDYVDGGYTVPVVGTAVIKDSSGNDVTSHFKISTQNGTLVIERAPVTVTAQDAEKKTGEADPAFTAVVDGLVNSEAESLIDYTITRESGETAGSYAINPEGEAEQGNYIVTYVPATLVITEADKPEPEPQPEPGFDIKVNHTAVIVPALVVDSSAPSMMRISKEVRADSSLPFTGENEAKVGSFLEYRSTVTLNPGSKDVFVHDIMDEGLSFDGNGTVRVCTDSALTKELDAAAYHVLETPDSGDTFTLKFSDDWLSGLSGSATLYVTYTAHLKEQAEGVQYNRTKLSVAGSTIQEDSTRTTALPNEAN